MNLTSYAQNYEDVIIFHALMNITPPQLIYFG